MPVERGLKQTYISSDQFYGGEIDMEIEFELGIIDVPQFQQNLNYSTIRRR